MRYAGETACATNGKSFACIGGTGFSLSTPACRRNFSPLPTVGALIDVRLLGAHVVEVEGTTTADPDPHRAKRGKVGRGTVRREIKRHGAGGTGILVAPASGLAPCVAGPSLNGDGRRGAGGQSLHVHFDGGFAGDVQWRWQTKAEPVRHATGRGDGEAVIAIGMERVGLRDGGGEAVHAVPAVGAGLKRLDDDGRIRNGWRSRAQIVEIEGSWSVEVHAHGVDVGQIGGAAAAVELCRVELERQRGDRVGWQGRPWIRSLAPGPARAGLESNGGAAAKCGALYVDRDRGPAGEIDRGWEGHAEPAAAGCVHLQADVDIRVEFSALRDRPGTRAERTPAIGSRLERFEDQRAVLAGIHGYQQVGGIGQLAATVLDRIRGLGGAVESRDGLKLHLLPHETEHSPVDGNERLLAGSVGVEIEGSGVDGRSEEHTSEEHTSEL